ncbi:MAG: quinol:electron acceptor oxidoreductase subunit ActD, partial [Pirellulaceae bacterium]
MSNETNSPQEQRLVGILGQFEDPKSLLHACESARDAGIRKMDAFTPFPVHGIEKAMGVPRTILPFIVLAVGLTGCAVGLGMQWYTNATEQLIPIWSGYQFKISGKPFFSLPANIPVTFEVIVLSSAFAAFLGMLALNGLPRLANPLHRIPRFKRVTNDKFFLVFDAAEEGFDIEQARTRMSEWGATAVEDVEEDLTDHTLPPFLRTATILTLVLLMVPPVLVFRGRGMTSRQTRVHAIPDMDFQNRYGAQQVGPVATNDGGWLFPQIRAALDPVPDTVPRDSMSGDSEFYRGFVPGDPSMSMHHTPAVMVSTTQEQEEGADEPPAIPEPDWVTEFPQREGLFEVSEQAVHDGQRLFNVYCMVCHGYAGEGDGLVSQRAVALAANANATWTAAKSLYDPEVVKQPVGRLFDTITNGRSTMGPYASRISPE